MTLTNGNALAGRLAKAAKDAGVEMWLSSPLVDLNVDTGKVSGATVLRDSHEVQVNARYGVVLACGGFPHDIARRKLLFPHTPTGTEHYTPSPGANTGDGLRSAEKAGGWIDTTIPNAAAWCPTSLVPRKDGSMGVMPHFIDRAKPGVIAVTANGKRFTNEAFSYHDFVQDWVRACNDRGQTEYSAWLICDHKHLREYGLGAVAPFPLPIGRHLRSGYLKRADSIPELALQMGVPEDALAQQIEWFNQDAIIGVDRQFGKGSTAYNRYQGDSLVKPNPCMAPIQNGPFYAIKIVIGDIGTFAGLATDANCQVLDTDKKVIDGLFAVGNDAASIMGGNYPGAGITLGPAVTLGYVAALSVVKQQLKVSQSLLQAHIHQTEKISVARS